MPQMHTLILSTLPASNLPCAQLGSGNSSSIGTCGLSLVYLLAPHHLHPVSNHFHSHSSNASPSTSCSSACDARNLSCSDAAIAALE